MKVVIVIPTYNEAENIGNLIPILAEEFKKLPQHEFNILVVDDSSPDGTADVVKKVQNEFSFVHLLLRKEKAGLGAAYVSGFKHAMRHLNADVLMEMDADFQHNPKDVVRFVKEIDSGYDYVIGSRFMKGGSIPAEWALYRKILSWGGNVFSKIVLGIFNLNDFTSGFKASRVKGFVDKLDLDDVRSEGFAYKIDLLFRMHKAGARIKEIPIEFGLRDRGDSKMERSNLIDSLRVVLTIRINESQSFFKFVVVGFIGLGVDLSLFNILRITILSSKYASATSGLIAMTVTYIFNNFWSFGDRKIVSLNKTAKSLVIYYISSYMPVVFRSWLISFSVNMLGDTFLVSNIAFFIGIAIGLVWNFTVYSKIVWRHRN